MPGRIMVRVGPEPIEPAELTRFVSDEACGGNVLFTGTPRTTDGVEFLHYEAWLEQAERVLDGICASVLRSTGAVHAAVQHRTGRVEGAEAAVAVAVSAPHRAEAFAACMAIIDELKRTAPIWKREHTQDSSVWTANPEAAS